MDSIAKKLHSQSGASMLMALAFFLVCGFAAAIILGAAATNAQKISGRREDQQTYYSVSSAARLLQDVMEEETFTGREYKTIYECNSDAYRSILVYHDAHTDLFSADEMSAAEISRPDETVSEFLKQQAYSVFRSKTEYVNGITFTEYSQTFVLDAEGMDPVEVVMTVREDYQVVFTLHSQTSPQLYGMTLTCPARTPDIQESHTDGSCTHWVKTDEDEQAERQFSLTEYTRTTTVVWDRGTITKGVDTDAGA